MILGKKMLRPPQINEYVPRINIIASEMITRIKMVQNSSQGENCLEVDDLDMELFKWSFETVADFLFDRRFNSLSENPPKDTTIFIKAVGDFLNSIVGVSMLPPSFYRYIQTQAFKKFDSNFLLMYNIAEKLIDEKLEDVAHRRKSDKSGFESELIPFLLSTNRIDEDEVVSSIVDTLFAGVDTSSNTMQWMLYLLAKHPEVQSRIREEINSVATKGCQLDESMLQKIPLVKCVIKETLRLYPVLVVTGRILNEDVVLSGYQVPVNTPLLFMHHGMGRREDLFANANSFLPERWLRVGSRSTAEAFASIPFGFGVRMCLGRRLAELEMQILLVKILQQFRLDIEPGHNVSQYMRGTSIPDKPIRVKFFNI